MGNIREIGLGVQDNRDDSHRRRIEEEHRPDNQVLMNKWAFRTSCVNRSRAYNDDSSTPGSANDIEASTRGIS